MTPIDGLADFIKSQHNTYRDQHKLSSGGELFNSENEKDWEFTANEQKGKQRNKNYWEEKNHKSRSTLAKWRDKMVRHSIRYRMWSNI